MDFRFTPTGNQSNDLNIPNIEDARSDFAPYYTAYKNHTVESAKTQVITELAKLGAGGILFQEGYFEHGKAKRHGYNVYFQYGRAKGVIRVAGLPIGKSATETKIKQVRVQALLNVRDWLKAAVTSRVFSPGGDALIPHMLVDGQRTVADYIHAQGQLPQLNAPSEIVVE